MAESTRLVDLVQPESIGSSMTRAAHSRRDHPRTLPIEAFARDLLGGGKRFRALFCYWGWQAVGRRIRLPRIRPSHDRRAARLRVGRRVRDRARDVPRGRPGARRHHRQLRHPARGASRPPPVRGAARRERLARVGTRRSAGPPRLLLGDLLLGWSDELLDAGLARLSSRGSAQRPARSSTGCAPR